MKTREQEAALNLACEWERRAKLKFTDAEREQDPMHRRLVEHGAVCYFNAAAELRAAFGLPYNAELTGEPRSGESSEQSERG